jgi:hypothetical protein
LAPEEQAKLVDDKINGRGSYDDVGQPSSRTHVLRVTRGEPYTDIDGYERTVTIHAFGRKYTIMVRQICMMSPSMF